MRITLISFLLSVACLAGDRVITPNDRYSLEFPPKWTKTQSPMRKDADFARQNPEETVIVTVITKELPEGAAADLDAIAKAGAGTYGKAIKFEGEPKISPGQMDGCDARFLTLLPEEGAVGIVTVYIGAPKDFVEINAIVTMPASDETLSECLEIVKSFRREGIGGDKEEEEKEDKEKDE